MSDGEHTGFARHAELLAVSRATPLDQPEEKFVVMTLRLEPQKSWVPSNIALSEPAARRLLVELERVLQSSITP